MTASESKMKWVARHNTHTITDATAERTVNKDGDVEGKKQT
jgi:hypothetical protein